MVDHFVLLVNLEDESVVDLEHSEDLNVNSSWKNNKGKNKRENVSFYAWR